MSLKSIRLMLTCIAVLSAIAGGLCLYFSGFTVTSVYVLIGSLVISLMAIYLYVLATDLSLLSDEIKWD